MTRMQMNGFDEIDAAVLDHQADDEPVRGAALSAPGARAESPALCAEALAPSRAVDTRALPHPASATPITAHGSRVSKR